MLATNIAFDFSREEYKGVDALELGPFGTLIRHYADAHGKHSNGRMHVRQVAELGIDTIGEDGLDRMRILLRRLHCADASRSDEASALDMLEYIRDAGIKSLTVPLKALLVITGRMDHGDSPDARLIEALACWYASFDADFEATFFTMPRGMLTSAEIASYFTLPSFIEMARVADGASAGSRVTARRVVDAMMRAPFFGLRTPLSDVMSMSTNDDRYVTTDYRRAERLLARHEGTFAVNGIRFEEMESGIGSVPYQSHGEPDFEADGALARAVMHIVSANGWLPASTIDVAEQFASDVMPEQGGPGILADIMRTFRKLVIDKVTKEGDSVATIYARKSRDLQRAMSLAVMRQRSGDACPVASLEMLECCKSVLGDGAVGPTPDAVREAMEHDYSVIDEERIGMGSYENSVPRLMPALAVSYRFCCMANDDMHGDGHDGFTATDVLCALLSMRCAVSSAASDGDRVHATPIDITNCYSEDVDVPPQRMDGVEMLSTLERELGDESRIMACIGIPSLCVPTYIGMSAMSGSVTPEDMLASVQDGLFPMVAKAFCEIPKADDPFVLESNGEVPSQLMRMVFERGNIMSRHGDLDTLEDNGVMPEQRSPLVTMLGIMEFYACLVADGGYGKYIRDVGHITALVHDEMAAFDVYNEVMQSVNGTYDAGDGARYHEATNPFNSTVTDGGCGRAAKTDDDDQHHARAIRQYAVDVTAMAEADARRGYRHGIGRDTMVASIGMVIASRTRNVPMIVGRHGTGRMDIALAFAHWALGGDAPASLRGSRVFAVRDDVQDVPHATEILVTALSKTPGTVLLVRDAMDLYAGVTNAKSMLRTVIDSGMRTIVLTDVRGAKTIAERDPYAMDMMIRLDMPTLSDDALSAILWQHVRVDGSKGIDVRPSAINAIVGGVGAASLASAASPRREIETLEYAISYAASHEGGRVSDEDVRMSMRLLECGDGAVADDPFEDVAGQADAKRVVSERLAASRIGLYDAHGPRNVFLFCGPSGCGKTLLASHINRAIGVDDDGVLVIPMSEYSTKWEGTRLIGSAPGYIGYEQGGMLTNFVKAHPNGVLILDEIEKAHPNIIMMFLNMFDTGVIDSAQGEHVDCHKLTVVCTSNAAFDDYGSSGVIGFVQSRKPTYEESVASVRAELVKRLGAPFVGRIPDVIVFGELDDDDMVEAMVINYRHLAKEYGKRIGMDVGKIVSDDDVREIARGLLSTANRETGVRGMWKDVEKRIDERIVASICPSGTTMS